MSSFLNYVNVEFHDAQTGRNITVQLSPADAQRVQNDVTFAQRLMKAAIAPEDTPQQVQQRDQERYQLQQLAVQSGQQPAQQLEQAGPTASSSNNVMEFAEQRISIEPGPSSSGSSSSCSSRVEESERENIQGAFKWPHQAILLLIETFRSLEGDPTSGKLSQKAWEKISAVLVERGYMVTGPQCMSKFNGMKRSFKAISDHNSKSGNHPRSWAYFDVMQSLLGERPFMVPPSIASSSTAQERSTSESSLERSTESSASSPTIRRHRKRATCDSLSIAESILESHRISEERKKARFAMKMETLDRFMGKLDQLLEKL